MRTTVLLLLTACGHAPAPAASTAAPTATHVAPPPDTPPPPPAPTPPPPPTADDYWAQGEPVPSPKGCPALAVGRRPWHPSATPPAVWCAPKPGVTFSEHVDFRHEVVVPLGVDAPGPITLVAPKTAVAFSDPTLVVIMLPGQPLHCSGTQLPPEPDESPTPPPTRTAIRVPRAKRILIHEPPQCDPRLP